MGSPEERVLVLAPRGRDAALAIELFNRHAISAASCASVKDIAAGIRNAGCALMTQEALSSQAIALLEAELLAQPAWSDFPFILLVPKPEPGSYTTNTWQALGNVTVLERPTQSRTLLSAVKAALRARRRQYEVREAIQRRDQFLAMLGHELRNPLAAIALATATDGVKSEEGRRQREIVARQTRHLSKLVDDLLDVARVTTGKVILHNVTLDINEVLRRCLQAAEMGAQKSGIRIVPNLWPQPLCVLGDMVRLEEVFSNLLWNAIKYSPPHSRIDVVTAPAGDRCVLEVQDTGIGIAAEMLPRVFDLFTQAEVSLDRTQAGLGIGLTLVKSLVELHGGSVDAQSDGIGRGSRFCVSLPLSRAALAEALPMSTLEDEPAPIPLPVLVVDDNVDLLEMTKEVLEGFGCEVQTASDGPSGLARLCAFQPALAFIDIGLPGLDGYRLVSEARANLSLMAVTARPWLVALTGYGQPEDRQRALAAGFDEHLIKPVSINALRQAIKDASGATQRRAAS